MTIVSKVSIYEQEGDAKIGKIILLLKSRHFKDKSHQDQLISISQSPLKFLTMKESSYNSLNLDQYFAGM